MFWVQRNKVRKPDGNSNLREMIGLGNEIILQGGQTIELLFKFFSKRESDPDKKIPGSEKYIRPRNITVTIKENSSASIEAILQIYVIPCLPVIDQSVVRYEPEQSRFCINIPPFLSSEVHSAISWEISDPSMEVALIKENDLITVSG